MPAIAMRATALGRPVGGHRVGGHRVGGRHAGDSLVSDHAHKLAVLRALLLKLDVPVFLRQQRVITTDTDIRASMKARATLPDKNVASNNLLPAKHFDA